MKSIPVYVCLLVWAVCSSCQTGSDVETIYNALKPGQAKISIRIDGNEFYPSASIFKGSTMVYPNTFRLNVTDQFESNIIVSFQGDQWFKDRPARRKVFVDNQVVGSVMIGRLIDKANRRGEGYLMTDGEITVESISDKKLVLRLEGKVGKYEYQRVPAKWNMMRGLIVYKRPALTLQGVSKEEVYF